MNKLTITISGAQGTGKGLLRQIIEEAFQNEGGGLNSEALAFIKESGVVFQEITTHVSPDEEAAILLEVAAAAKAWNRSAVKGTKRLKKAVKAWIAIGG